MNVVHVSPYYPPAWDYGGPVRVAQATCEGLAARGHRVTVVTTDARDRAGRASPAEEMRGGVRVLRARNLSNRLAWQRIFVPVGVKAMLQDVLAEADVAHLHEARSLLHLAAGPLLRARGVPYLLTAHGSLPYHRQHSLPKQIYDLMGGGRVFRQACRWHAVSDMEAGQFEKAGADPARIAIVPNGIFPDEYASLPDGAAFRESLDIAPDKPLVLFLSRLHPIKGVRFLVDAFARLHALLPEAVLALVGPDDGAEADARRQVRSLGLGDAVRFVPGLFGADKLAAYRAADAYVLPSRFDVFSIGLVEAMACGAPVVVSRGCALAGEVAQRDAGSVVDYGDVGALADTLHATLTGLQAARQQGERGRKWALQNFDWDAIVTVLEGLYTDCREGTWQS